jgi:hypothetical protein
MEAPDNVIGLNIVFLWSSRDIPGGRKPSRGDRHGTANHRMQATPGAAFNAKLTAAAWRDKPSYRGPRT